MIYYRKASRAVVIAGRPSCFSYVESRSTNRQAIATIDLPLKYIIVKANAALFDSAD